MIDLIFVIVVAGFALELTALYEVYQNVSDLRQLIAELYTRRPKAGSPWPSASAPG